MEDSRLPPTPLPEGLQPPFAPLYRLYGLCTLQRLPVTSHPLLPRAESGVSWVEANECGRPQNGLRGGGGSRRAVTAPSWGLCFFNTRFRMRNVLLRPVKLWRIRFRTGNQNKFFTQHIINLRNSQPQDGMAIGLDGSKMGIWKSISNS